MSFEGSYGTDIDNIGTAECPIAPYFLDAEARIISGQSLAAWERYWRAADPIRWIGSVLYARIVASRVRETLDALTPSPVLPPADLTAAQTSVAQTINGTIPLAMQNAAIANGAEARQRSDAQQAFTSGGN
jgi:hypothetical protein